MKINRQEAIVQNFEYKTLTKIHKAQTSFQTVIDPLDLSKLNTSFSGEHSVFGLRMTYNLVIGKRIVIVGNITQLVEIEEKVIDKIEDFSKTELNKLFQPLFRMLEELVYEVTQITLDKKGIALNFTADYD